MLVLSAKDVEEAMDYVSLTEALRQSFRSHIVTPVRHHHTIDFPDQAAATLLLMPGLEGRQGSRNVKRRLHRHQDPDGLS